MTETIFTDRRKDAERRNGHQPYGVRDCRRRARDRRREQAAAEPTACWWLNVNYSSSDN